MDFGPLAFRDSDVPGRKLIIEHIVNERRMELLAKGLGFREWLELLLRGRRSDEAYGDQAEQ